MKWWIRGSKIASVLIIAMLAAGLSACTKSVVNQKSSGASMPRTSTPKPGVSVTVKRGDTLYSLARNNGINVNDLAAWNRLSSPYTIYPGQRLQLYPGTRRTASTSSTSARTPPSSSGTTTGTGASARTTTAPASSGFSWRWPTAGTVVGRYVAGETTKQGIDIAGSSGQAVIAAADGSVVYSGAGLVGYGELIIVKHNDNWLSAYGHNRRRLVNEGQTVKAGQQIAEMGRTGASRDMLHFEIRYQGKPVDPMLYLPKR